MRTLTRAAVKICKDKKISLWVVFLLIIYFIFVFKFVTINEAFNSWLFGSYGVLITVYILTRFLLSFFYEPVPDNDYEPTVTFVVPAMNEEDVIKITLEAIYKVDYPKEKLEVITINDGSKDNTLARMKEVQRKHPDLVIVDWKQNRGKRHGMAEGIRRAKNEILIFIDSDSFVDRDAIRPLVKYFKDPKVGAVSGHTDVFNADTNTLTKMQAVRYYIAFSVLKSAEGIFGTVTCCAGCFSAYRREYVLEVLDEWLNQKFLGVTCTYGDDRSLTNFLLKKYELKFSSESHAWTMVPEKNRQFFKQQLRWKKSWMRESLRASLFIWKRNPLVAFSFYAGIILSLMAPVVIIRALIWYPVVHHQFPLYYFAGLILITFLYGFFYYIKTGYRYWIHGAMATVFYSLLLVWQLPYAILTIRDPKWGTR